MYKASKIFWRKFIRYSLVGFSALIILAGFNYVDGFQRGPLPASAQEIYQGDSLSGTQSDLFIAQYLGDSVSLGQSDLPNSNYPGDSISLGQQNLPQPSTPSCSEVRNTPYGQCGGTVGLEGRDPTHQFEVVRITDSCTGGILRYEVTRDAGPAEACGFQPASPPQGAPQPQSQPQPQPQPQAQPSQYQNYSACGQSGQLWVGGGYRPLQGSDCTGNTFLKIYRDQSGYITNACEAVPAGNVRNSDGCGYSAAPATTTPVSTCGRQEVDEGCADNGFRSFRTIDTCSGFSSARRVWDSACASTTFDGCQESVVASFCSSQSSRTERVRNTCDGMGEFTRTVWDSNCGFFQSPFFQSPFCSPTEIFSSDTCVGNGTRERVFTNSCTGGEMRRERFFDGNCLVRGSVVTQPAVVRFATLDAVCPAGSTRTVEGNVVTCTVTAPTTFGNVGVARVVTAQAPAVAGVKELPKTGLPLLAWAALAFIPAGFKIRGFSKIKEETSAKPHFLYEERQFKTNLDTTM